MYIVSLFEIMESDSSCINMGDETMGIMWYAPRAKQGVDVKLTKSSIVITQSGVEKLVSIDSRFENATHAKLGWDADHSLVAIAPAADGEKGVFKIGRRGRDQNTRTINGAKFLQAFNLVVDPDAPNAPELSGENGVAVFKLNIRGAVPSTNGIAPIGRRRGRIPKLAAV
jgi:hypothetical protein